MRKPLLNNILKNSPVKTAIKAAIKAVISASIRATTRTALGNPLGSVLRSASGLICKFLFTSCLLFIVSSANAGSYEEFFKAIAADNAVVLSNLLKQGFDPNTPTADGQTPLIQAIKVGAEQSIRLLINSKGVDLERTNLQDESALMMAAFSGNFEIVKHLVSLGVEINKTGWTPLHYAATKGNIDIIKFLLLHSAYIDSESPNGTTPLMMAARYGTPEAVHLLIEEGADPTIKNNLQLSALDFAVMANNPKLISYLKTQTSIWILSHP